MKILTLALTLLTLLLLSCSKNRIAKKQELLAINSTRPVSLLNLQSVEYDSITMDIPGDYVNASNDYLKNDSTGMNFVADIQGSGWLYGSHTSPVPIIKTSEARYANSYALRFTLPARTTAYTYDQAEKDRLESHIIQSAPIGDFLNTNHYSGFSIMIPSGFGNAPDWCVIHQMWQSSPESPPISLNLLPGYPARLALSCLWGKDKAHSHGGFQPRVDDSSGDTYIDLPRNKWIDFIIRWKT